MRQATSAANTASRARPFAVRMGLRISRYCPECGSPDAFVVAWPEIRCLRCDCSYGLNESDLSPANPLLADQGQIPLEGLGKIDRWRMMAEEIRAYADNVRSSDARDTLRRIAQQYDQLAEKAERQLKS